MSSLTLNSQTHAEIASWLDSDNWIVACLCAAWCDTCRAYRRTFDELAARHPDKRFIWIDIEDQADLVGDLDVENFPSLLIQRRDMVVFFGPVLPEMKLADRLIQAQADRSEDELRAEASVSAERRIWQEQCNLRERLSPAVPHGGAAGSREQ